MKKSQYFEISNKLKKKKKEKSYKMPEVPALRECDTLCNQRRIDSNSLFHMRTSEGPEATLWCLSELFIAS